jgi:hypothetical protein
MKSKLYAPHTYQFFYFFFTAYTDLGKSIVAHNMALSFLLTWFPILVLLSIIDASRAGCSDSRVEPLNEIIRSCRLQLQDAKFRGDLARECGASEIHFTFGPSSLSTTQGMFHKFAGQGRQPWFRGAAPSIMADSEEHYIADAGRGWLLREKRAMEALLLPPIGPRRSAFYPDALGQSIAAFAIVIGCAGSAIIVSYFTPTVGLGCRSNGYVVNVCITVALVVLETCMWGFADIRKSTLRSFAAAILALGEALNTVWTLFISIAQTLGVYESCECRARMPGGYIDMAHQKNEPPYVVLPYWLTGTIVASFILAASCAFIVDQWCTQSYLSTSDYGKALRGLKKTRKYIRYTYYFRFGPETLTLIFRKVFALVTCGKWKRKHLRWAVKTKSKRSKRSRSMAMRFHHGTHERIMSIADSVLSR